MSRLLPPQYSRVLEIGCGSGGFRDNLKLDHEYWGIEPVEAAATLALGKLDKVLIGTYDGVADQLPDAFFDLVICNDVIEHMPDHDLFLEAIKQKLAPGACVLASIPNVRYLRNLYEILVKKDWEYKDKGILDRTHLRFFTEKSLRRTLQAHGYAIEHFAGINPRQNLSNTPMGKIKDSLVALLILLVGQDTQFLQFGIRIRYAGMG